MDDDSPLLGVGFAIDFHDSFGQLRSLDDLIGTTQANVVREFQRIEAASKGAIDLGAATAQVKAFGNAATRELASAARETARAEKAGEALVRQLDRQNNAFGKTREELRMMKAEAAAAAAEKQGLTELAARIRATEAELAGKELAAARRARFAAEEIAETRAAAEAAAAARATADRIRAERQLALQLGERAQLEAAIQRNTGVGRTKATDAGATFSALAAKAADDEARAANAAAVAQERLAREHKELAAAVQASRAAQVADADAAERLRMATDPLYAATKRLNAEIAESTRLYRAGATAPAEYARQQQVLTERLNMVGQAHDTSTKAGRRNQLMLTQLSFQLNDVATMAMSGAGAFQIFATQAGQIFQIGQMADGGFKGMARSIGAVTASVLGFVASSPLLLGAIATLGGAGVALKLINDEANKGDPMKAYVASLGLTAKEIRQLDDVTVTYGDTIKAVFQLAGGAIWGAIGEPVTKVWNWMKEWLSWAGTATADYLNLLISRGVRAYDAFVSTWKLFPAALSDIFVTAVNSAIESINGLLRKSVDGLNSFISDANSVLGRFGLALPTLSAIQIEQVVNNHKGAAQKVAKAWDDVLSTDVDKDYVGAAKAAIVTQSRLNAQERLRKQAEQKGFLDPEKGKSDKLAERLAREAEAIEAQIKNLYALADAYKISGAAALVAEARVKAESEAIKKRGDIEEFVNRQVRLSIAERVKDAAKATAAIREQANAQTQANSMVATGLFPAREAAQWVKDQIADLPLLAAAQAAQQRGLVEEAERATAALADQRAERDRLRESEEQGKLDVALEGGQERLAELREELRLIGESEAVRARSLALIRATTEAQRLFQDPAKQQQYIAQQMEIADATQAIADGVREHNDALTFAADKWDIIASNVRSAGQGMAEAFGDAGRAIGDMASIYADYHAYRERAQTEHDRRIREANGRETEIARENARFALRTSGIQIQAYGDMAAAAKGFFKEGSTGYKALAAAEKVYRVAQLAFSLQSMIQNSAETATTVANAEVRATAEGTAGIAAQSKLPFPFNIAAMAATGAALIAAGVAVFGGGGGGKNTLPQSNTGTGTVLGDGSAQSESVVHAIEALRDVDTVMLSYSRQMANSLRSIDNQIGGFASLVLRTGDVNASGGVTEGFSANAIGSTLGAIPVIGGILKGLFGTKTKVVGSGLFGEAQTLEDILGNGFDASYYSDIQKKKKFFGITTSTRYSTRYTDADAGLENQFTLILREFNNAILAAAGPLGESTDAIRDKLSGFVVDIGKIDLQGLTGEEIQEKLSAVFGAAADKMATAAFPGIERFQAVGEGLFETLVRVSSTVESVTASLDLLGSSALDLSVDNKVALAGQFENVGEFTSAIEGYFEAIYTEEEQVAARTTQMAQVFESLGATMPSSIEAFRSLVEAQDLTTAAGQSTYATLLQLAPAFADLQNAMEGARSAADILAERQGLERQRLELLGDTEGLRALDLAKLDPSNRDYQSETWQIDDDRKAAADLAATRKAEADEARRLAIAIAELEDPARARAMQLEDERAAVLDVNLADYDRLQVLKTQAAEIAKQAEVAKAARAIEIEIMELSGDALGALAARRDDEKAAADASLGPLLDRRNALQDDAAATAKANQVAASRRDLEIEIMELSGDAAGALAARRDIERETTAALDESLLPRLEYKFALQDQASAQAKAEEAAQAYNEALDNQARRVEEARGVLIAAHERETTALQGTIDKLRDFGSTVRDFRLGATAGVSPTLDYTGSQARFLSTARAAGGFDEAAMGRFTSEAQAFLDLSRSRSTTATEYERDLALVAREAFKLEELAGGRASAAEREKASLDAQLQTALGVQTLAETNISFAEAMRAFVSTQAEVVPEFTSTVSDGLASLAGTLQQSADAQAEQNDDRKAEAISLAGRLANIETLLERVIRDNKVMVGSDEKTQVEGSVTVANGAANPVPVTTTA